MLVSRFLASITYQQICQQSDRMLANSTRTYANVRIPGYPSKEGKFFASATDDERLRTLADRQCGGPGRTRTCNQTVMSGRLLPLSYRPRRGSAECAAKQRCRDRLQADRRSGNAVGSSCLPIAPEAWQA